MRTYARIQDGLIAELVSTSGNITEMFSPLLAWIDVTGSPEVQVGWVCEGAQFAAPTRLAEPAAPSLALLQAQLTQLTQQFAALAAAT